MIRASLSSSFKSTALLALTIAAVGSLAGCNLGPHYARPDIPAPAAWAPVTTESTNTGPRAPDSPAWPDGQWWHAFGSAELDRLIAQAQQANDDVKAAMARVSQADAQVRIASAPLLPSLGAGFTPTRTRQIQPMPPAGRTLNGGRRLVPPTSIGSWVRRSRPMMT